MMTLTENEYARYSRHLVLNGFGEAAQLKLKSARVLVIGAGGLGSPILLYLAAAGVGAIGIVDYDYIDISNLQRQILFTTQDTGLDKSKTAATKLRALNPLVNVITYNTKITSDNAMDIVADYDIIADGSDNFPTRYLVNDAAVLCGKALVYGSVFRFEGQVSIFNLADKTGTRGPNYRDLFPVPPAPETVPDCNEAGVLGVLPGIIGSMQALEVLKIITGIGETLNGKIYHFDALAMSGLTFTLNRRADNPLNGQHPTITSLIDYDEFCAGDIKIKQISVQDFHRLKINGTAFNLVDVRSPVEYNNSNIGGRLFPLDEIMLVRPDLEETTTLILHCKTGSRSAKAIRQLITVYGFDKDKIWNLDGGLDAYNAYLQAGT